MKSNLLLRSGVTFLILAGAAAPLSAEGVIGLRDMYEQLTTFHSQQKWATATELGAQGPIREESMATERESSMIPRLGAGEGDMYETLAYAQSHRMPSDSYGAQGPIRNEGMDTFQYSSGEGDTYDKLQRMQSVH